MTSEAKKSFESNPYHEMNIFTNFHQSSPFVFVDIEVLLKIVFFGLRGRERPRRPKISL